MSAYTEELVPQFVILQMGLEGIFVHGPWPSDEAAHDARETFETTWQQGTDSFWVIELTPPPDGGKDLQSDNEPNLFA